MSSFRRKAKPTNPVQNPPGAMPVQGQLVPIQTAFGIVAIEAQGPPTALHLLTCLAAAMQVVLVEQRKAQAEAIAQAQAAAQAQAEAQAVQMHGPDGLPVAPGDAPAPRIIHATALGAPNLRQQ